MSFTDVLAIVGGFAVVFHLLKLAWRCWDGFKEFVLSEIWQVDLRTFGQWAVVTGATSGIGKAYASELARRGLNVVLVSRSDDKLQMVAKEIEDRHGRNTRTIQVDFTDGHSIYPTIAAALQGLEIGILVNNMTRLVLPGMVERGTGLIINISSEVGVHPQPLLSLYSATKIFVTYFSQCLHAEYKSNGIIVQCVAPFMVSTNMTHNMRVNCFVKTASGFAREALNTVGHSSYTSGCLSHALQVRGMRDYDHLQIVSCCNILTSPPSPSLSSYRAWLSQYSCQTGFVCQQSSSESYETLQKSANMKEECARKRRRSVKRRSSYVTASAQRMKVTKWMKITDMSTFTA
ncbi:hydroxysteroid (20-beta) dehydrogenase 2 isoform X2 [Siniperca chuatsi]|uniref:hydroxysteroid (20-beta) dehydrogenase 2 isoform X2 n=1 Tax=Siniperca chuatsi TaxID=119488 RepID=UPI001CE05A73|nr:hydroxysteroid (20-beta) dehydrogenase 2 isoform X2 [Siniperca chuatsi]